MIWEVFVGVLIGGRVTIKYEWIFQRQILQILKSQKLQFQKHRTYRSFKIIFSDADLIVSGIKKLKNLKR